MGGGSQGSPVPMSPAPVPSRVAMPCGRGARPRHQPWGDTPPSLGPIPRAHGRPGNRFGSGGRLSSPSPAEKVSSSPMKAVEGTDMMKAGRCLLPREEHSFPVASPLPSRAAPQLAARPAALPPPLPTARWLSKPKAQNISYLQSEGLFSLPHRGWFVVQGPPSPPVPYLCSSFILRLLLCLRLLGARERERSIGCRHG